MWVKQSVFRRLSIFPSGFTLRAATEIASDLVSGDENETMELIAELATKSLLVADAGVLTPPAALSQQ